MYSKTPKTKQTGAIVKVSTHLHTLVLMAFVLYICVPMRKNRPNFVFELSHCGLPNIYFRFLFVHGHTSFLLDFMTMTHFPDITVRREKAIVKRN